MFVIYPTGLSGWMRYDGFFINGHTRREIPSVTSEEDCWSFCLMESRFDCLAVAYAARGNHSCLLYDVRALSVVGDWTPSEYFTYFEFCVNGNATLPWKSFWADYGLLSCLALELQITLQLNHMFKIICNELK